METCASAVPTIPSRGLTKQYLNPSCPSIQLAIFNKNSLSTPPYYSVCACTSASHLGSRQRAQAVKPINALGSSRGSLSPSLDSVGTSSNLWMPRPKDLDTTNMLLRQRIVFLGSQVCFSAPSIIRFSRRRMSSSAELVIVALWQFLQHNATNIPIQQNTMQGLTTWVFLKLVLYAGIALRVTFVSPWSLPLFPYKQFNCIHKVGFNTICGYTACNFWIT